MFALAAVAAAPAQLLNTRLCLAVQWHVCVLTDVVACLSLGPVDLSVRALSGRLQFTVRRHKFNNDSLLAAVAAAHGHVPRGGGAAFDGQLCVAVQWHVCV